MKSHSTYKLLAVAVLSALLAVGCQKDDKEKVSVKVPSSGLLSFGISQNDGWSSPATKADGDLQTKGSSFRSEMLLMDCEDGESPLGDVYIYMIEEDINDIIHDTLSMSETVVTRSGALDTYAYGVYAYQGSGEVPNTYNPEESQPFEDIQNLGLYSNGKYEGQEEGREIYAPGAGTWLYFYAYAPYMLPNPVDDATNPKLMVADNYPYITYTATHELAKTTDLIFGGTAAPQSGEVNEAIELSVSHILSKIRVQSGNIASGRITSIALKDICNAGSFNSDNSGVWTLDDSKKTDYAKTAATGNVEFEDIFLIPQTLSDNAVIEIKVHVPNPTGTEREYVLTKKLNAFLSTWQSNKQYTYTISTPHEVEITVSDNIETVGTYPVKKDMVIKNTGLADAYVRVAITGSWVVDHTEGGETKQFTISSWNESDGEFAWPSAGKPVQGSTNSNFWRLCEDGYYYFMKPLKPGEQTLPLFDSYTLTAPSPTGGAYLELIILANGVFVPDVENVFPEEIVSNL